MIKENIETINKKKLELKKSMKIENININGLPHAIKIDQGIEDINSLQI